ncbi:MAG: hypothetical protein JNL67_02115 [Planctomycetaceae bacterium]|nr:hypothetical protein [Planctomycetaceae bacterium]
MTDASWPELDERSLEFWLTALGDNELGSNQKKQLWQYLESHPHHWRACAMALWDSQCLQQEVRVVGSSDSRQMPETKRQDTAFPAAVATEMGSLCTIATDVATAIGRKPLRTRAAYFWTSVLLATSAIVLTTLFSAWWMISTRGATIAKLNHELSIAQQSIEYLTCTMLAERSMLRNLAGVFPDRPCLVEIENTGDRVVYLADGPVPEDLLRGLVNLGRVRVQPYQPDFETPLWKSLDRPVVAIEVDKFSSLLVAQGDSL